MASKKLLSTAPELQADDPLYGERMREAMFLEAATPPPEAPLSCSCGTVLGGAVRGVAVGTAHFCPKCFMSQGIRHRFPAAVAVNCPTCHCTTVDFSGQMRCSVCRAKGARPLR
jgi:hypothetical protein